MDPHVRQLIEHLGSHYNRIASARQMAEAVGLSTSRLAHLFKRDVGSSPAAYLKSLRMEKARELLHSTTLLVKEITVMTGFNDTSHFVRDFARRYGLSPIAYRKQFAGHSLQRLLPFEAADSANRKQKRPTDVD